MAGLDKDIFFHLLRIAIGEEDSLPVESLTDEQWQGIYKLSKAHSITQLVYSAILRLPAGQVPSRLILARFAASYMNAERKSVEMNSAVPQVLERLAAQGLRAVLLKGLGCARYYPDPITRVSGDIDLWLDAQRRTVASFARGYKADAVMEYHHIDCAFPEFKHVELHTTPSWMFNPIYNHRLQKWFRLQSVSIFPKEPSSQLTFCPDEFNLVFLAVHIYRHLFDEGVGLRQIVDYYLCMKHAGRVSDRLSSEFIRIGLGRFIRALMWVLGEVFALPEQDMIASPDAEAGRFLLREILLSGNFGSADKRNSELRSASHRTVKRGVLSIKRNLRFLRFFPGEVLWAPYWKLRQYFWRKLYN